MEQRISASGGPCGPKIKSRYVLAIMGSVGMGLIYGLKVALHVVIVTMVNNTAIQQENHDSVNFSSRCNFEEVNIGSKPNEDGPFDWNSEIQGWLLASYFFGYLVAQIPGGRIAELFSAKWVFFFALAINVICTLLSPVLSKQHYGALLLMRILQGIGGGVTFPACHVLLSQWAPPLERSVMSSIVYAGTSLGTVIFMLISGVIADKLGWEAVFYIEGGFSAIFLILWVCLVADSPEKQKLITPEERSFITQSIASESGGKVREAHPPMPWKAVFTSLPFLAILVAHTCSNWGWYMILIELPQYMKSVLKFEISQNAVLTSIPFFTMWIFSIILSKVLDHLRAKKKITTTIARKIGTLIASVIPSVCLIILIFNCNRTLAVVLMTVITTAIGGMFCGFLSNHIDIAPNYAGTLVAITNTVATIPGIVVPVLVGKLTKETPQNAWEIVFSITIVLYIIEIVTYTIFGSGNVQSWNSH